MKEGNSFLDNYSSLLITLEATFKASQPYIEAMSQLSKNPAYSNKLLDTASRLATIEGAIHLGAFDNGLGMTVSNMLKPYDALNGVESTLNALGNSFSAMMKPDIYSRFSSAMTAPYSISSQTAKKTLESLSRTFDNSWLKQESSWLVEKKILANIDTSALTGIGGQFAALCQLEKQTSLMPHIPDSLISAASQIASITAAIKPDISGKDLIASTRILSDYCDLASKQHKLIQKSSDQGEINWRLGVIDAASKYVDRQTTFALGLADELSDEEVVESPEDYSSDIDRSAVVLIPRYIGYTRRDNVSPSEGLAESSLVAINEKGKRIAKSITHIDRIQRDTGNERIFTLSESLADGLVNISTVVCTNIDQLGNVIDGLYFIFYENLEHIKLLVGGGDKKKGDQIIRDEDVYQIIFNVKTIRSDLRHDLDHGDDTKKNKKFLEVGECYKKYCGNRPLKPKDFRKLQEGLYDDLLVLIDKIISLQAGADKED